MVSRALLKVRSAFRAMNAMRARKGPYRFLIREWSGLSDLELAARVLETECFRRELEPIPIDLKGIESMLVLAPHQDDETIGAGGTMLMAAKAGVRVDVLYVTDGASQARGEARTRRRDEEAREVCRRVGARMHQLGISNPEPRPELKDLERLAEMLWELRPEVLLLPWLLDSPPKHRMVSHLLWMADRWRGLPDCETWGYQVHNSLIPNAYVDFTEVAEEKRGLLECFKSQNEGWTNYTHQTMGLGAWNAHYIRSVSPKYLEIFTTVPLDELLELVERFYFRDLGATYRGDGPVVAGMLALHDRVMKASKGRTRGKRRQDNVRTSAALPSTPPS